MCWMIGFTHTISNSCIRKLLVHITKVADFKQNIGQLSQMLAIKSSLCSEAWKSYPFLKTIFNDIKEKPILMNKVGESIFDRVDNYANLIAHSH